MGKNGKILKFPEPVKKSSQLAEFCAYWQKALDEYNEKEEIARKMPVLQAAVSPKSEGDELLPDRKPKV
jgi:hypothetical protein